jgi:hypothetical protein
MSDPSRTTTRLAWLIVAILAMNSVARTVNSFAGDVGIDFYHLWGIQASRSIATEELPNPYAAPERTAAVLNRYAARTGEEHLMQANMRRRVIDPTGTPLFYASLAVLPDDYTRAHTLFRFAQGLALVGGIVLLTRMLGVSLVNGCLLAAVTLATLGPFQIDQRVGNTNAIQLLFLAVLGWLAVRASAGGARWPGLALLAGLAFVTLFKPNLAPATIAIGIARWARAGTKPFLLEAAAGVVAAALLVVASGLWFGDLQVWQDWYAFLHGFEGQKLVNYPFSKGNWSSSVYLAERTGATAYTLSWLLFAVLLASALGATFAAAKRHGSAAAVQLRAVLGDPLLMASLGTVIAMACAPLFWSHYLVWGLFPALWLLFTGRRWDAGTILAAVALFIWWGAFANVVMNLGAMRESLFAQTFGWVLVWIGLLLRILRREAPADEDAAPAA